jgi:Cu2+-exporting ATPase
VTARAPDHPSSRARAPDCFHCGLPVAAGTSFGFEAADGWRAFCCPGCEAVSRSISGLGLDDYYRLRCATGERPAADATDLESFDDALVQARFVRVADDGVAEADLLLEGLRCAACAWLVEQAVARLPAVRSIEVAYATRRARLRWDPGAANLSTVLAAIRAVGYAAWPYEAGRVAQVESRERRTLLRRLWVAGLGMMQVMMYAVPGYLAADGEIGADAASLMRWAGLLLTLPVMCYSALPFFRGAWRDLRLRRLGMEVPVALGLAAAFTASAWATVAGAGEVYFDSVTMFVFLLLGGRYLELLARSKASRSLAHLARLVPQTAHLLGPGPEPAPKVVAVSALRVGDRVLVRPGETVPADGTLQDEAATVSEAWLSGESKPLARRHGDTILGGSVNAGSALLLEVTRVGSETALSAIHRLMERALAERPRWVEAAARAAGVFVAFILAASLAAGAVWLAIDPSRALWIAVSVLIVTCPCALALATPVAMTVAAGALARVNLVVTRSHAIEALAGATDVVFDKTGTLTHGEPRVTEVIALGDLARGEAIALAGALAQRSAHPLDKAIRGCAGDARPRHASHGVEAIPGQGLEATVGGRKVRMGSAAFVAGLHRRARPIAWLDSHDTQVWLGDERGWLAVLRLGDAVRPEARAALERLRGMGLRIHLLSGDEPAVAQRVAADLGIEQVTARASPAHKQQYVRELQRRGARVAMVGDGINDAPVLAQADVSIAMGGGADLAQVRGDAVLLSDSLADLARGVQLARRARGVIRQNLGWALAYNLVVIPLAFAGLVTPLAAGIGMSASSLAVVANALRLRA